MKYNFCNVVFHPENYLTHILPSFKFFGSIQFFLLVLCMYDSEWLLSKLQHVAVMFKILIFYVLINIIPCYLTLIF